MAKIKKITPLLFLFSGLIAAFYFDFDKYVDFQFLQTHQGIVKGFITDMPVQAALLYMSLYAVSTAFSLPFGTIMTISGGWLFGVLIGGILTVIGATIGACTFFWRRGMRFVRQWLHAQGRGCSNLRQVLNAIRPVIYWQ